MQTLSEEQLVGHVLGQYRIERLVGKGRLNIVYLARHQGAQRVDALALYPLPAHFSHEARTFFLQRFHKEAALITSLKHPHILPVYEHGEILGYPYLITPYTTNGSLADIIRHQGRCEHTFVTTILDQIVDGLSYAHGKGFIHGTLKPSNIVIHDDENIQVAGFGLMHILQRAGVDPTPMQYAHLLSIAETFLAAPEYVAPEIVQGQAVDQRSDVYALGCILYEMLSGRPPFTGNNPLEVAQMHTKQAFQPLRKLSPEVPVALASVVSQALARDPEVRFQNVRELGEAFTQASIGATRTLPAVHMNQVAKPSASAPLGPARSGSTGGWQLVPPIVTSRMPALKSTTTGLLASSDRHSASPQGTAKVKRPVELDSASSLVQPTLPPISPQEKKASPAAAQRQQVPDDIVQLPAQDDIVQLPGHGVTLSGNHASEADLVKAYEWWSPAEPLQAPPQAFAHQTKEKAPALVEPVAASMPNTDDLDWGLDMPRPLQSQKKRSATGALGQPGRKVKRRRVIAMISGGVVAAAGIGVAFNLGKLGMAPGMPQTARQQTTNTGQATTTKPAQTQQQNKPVASGQKQNPPANNPPKPAMPGHTGTVIGSKNLPANSAAAFNNPGDNQASLLVHLASGTFAAYERACTHVGVAVNYNPVTRMLECPAHGAVFDPANNGAVVKGPADTPLPPVKIAVNGDGTITAI
ncbi:protein kinase domain-containing protein [Dictyobacter aurantiacus]|uniref:non-specific serine/threonine protein kinase n=1 Tax=Dictyobacter aurantiacus TaxID=1936993 RepID=A0A401ZHG2_9CHLR|nr:protein kinase [Dictyobacter aurantiacus]GCE06324.1 hypothetical protein KDAU_36530 [Dictyobacter aurantiacus]